MVGLDDLVRKLYVALAAGDAPGVLALLTDDFDGTLAAGLPLGLGGRRVGPERMLKRGWWGIGRAFAVRAEPFEWIPCSDGRLVVIGRYVGAARSTGKAFEAEFTHVFAGRDGRIASLRQLTDTAAWAAALEGAR